MATNLYTLAMLGIETGESAEKPVCESNLVTTNLASAALMGIVTGIQTGKLVHQANSWPQTYICIQRTNTGTVTEVLPCNLVTKKPLSAPKLKIETRTPEEKPVCLSM